MSCYTIHRRKLLKRHKSFARAHPENDVSRVSDTARWSRADRRRGLDNEHRVIASFASGDLPQWYVSIRPATNEEDRAGVDAWVTTTSGDVAVQVKSSAARAAAFRDKHPGYDGVVVVVHPEMRDEEIRFLVLKDVFRVLVSREKGKAA